MYTTPQAGRNNLLSCCCCCRRCCGRTCCCKCNAFCLFLLLYSGVRLYLSVCDDGECIVLRADTTRMLMDKASSTHFYKRARFARAGICFKCEEEFMINDTFQPYSFFFFLVVSSFSSILSFK